MFYQDFYDYDQNYYNQEELQSNKFYVLDFKQGDVNGDRVIDNVFIIGTKPYGLESPFVDNITLVIQDGVTNRYTRVQIKENSGYNPTIFLGDFTGNKVDDILISIDSGGSGAIGYYYIYSFLNNIPKKVFDFEEFYNEYRYDVNYKDNYVVEVISRNLKEKYIIDIRYKGKEYLSEIYDENGKLKEPIKGDVNPLSGLYPVDIQRDGIYELYAVQRITGRYNADGLGYVLTTLKWDKSKFIPLIQQVGIFGESIE